MVVGFYLGLMNFRGVVNSTFLYALYNEKILRNKSLIFYDPNNKYNEQEVIQKFKRKFKLIGVSQFSDIDEYKNKFDLEYIIVQKGGANGDIHKVDGISGGTITSDGVTAMIEERLKRYLPYFKQLKE